MLNVRLFQSLKVKVLSCFKGKGQGEQKERKQKSLRRGYRCDILVTEIDERAVVVLVLTHASVLDGQNYLPLCNVANFFRFFDDSRVDNKPTTVQCCDVSMQFLH